MQEGRSVWGHELEELTGLDEEDYYDKSPDLKLCRPLLIFELTLLLHLYEMSPKVMYFKGTDIKEKSLKLNSSWM